MKAAILLDISRLLARAGRGAPTGIDRVEHAYAEHLLTLAPERLRFVAIHALDGLCELPAAAARRFIVLIGRQWRGDSSTKGQAWTASQVVWARALLRSQRPLRRVSSGPAPLYLLVSHRHLHRSSRIDAALRATGARLIPFVHDLIPITHPEYARPHHGAVHLQRIETVANLADGVIVNSEATSRELMPYLAAAGRTPRVLVAPLGVDLPRQPPRPSANPYFVCLNTIEPRKNHLLLLHVWRRLVAKRGAAAPRLILVGRRGWENENVVDLLERSPAVIGSVDERSGMGDAELASLLAGARALLFPSFAEGFGLPLAEALAAGVPALCSDLPALREVGRDVPEYLDPLDGVGWLEAIEAYTRDVEPRRQAQLARIPSWTAPNWSMHFQDVLAFLDSFAEHQGVDMSGGRKVKPKPPILGSLASNLAVRLRRPNAASPVELV